MRSGARAWRFGVVVAGALGVAAGCAARDTEPTEAPEIGLGLDLGDPNEPKPTAPTQEVDMTLSDTDVSASTVAQPTRPEVGSFKLCGSGGAGCGVSPHAAQDVSPLIAPTATIKPPPMLVDDDDLEPERKRRKRRRR